MKWLFVVFLSGCAAAKTTTDFKIGVDHKYPEDTSNISIMFEIKREF